MRSLYWIFAFVALTGCSTSRPLSETDDFWYAEQYWVLGISWTKPYYCMSNKEPQTKKVNPVCVEPKFPMPPQRPQSKLDEK